LFVILNIHSVLDERRLTAIRAALASDNAGFASGKTTAGSHARQVKNNEQAGGPAAAAITKQVSDVLLANPVFKTAARPKSFVRLLVSRYRPGMAYGTHVDDALMAGVRTDLSFTLFISEHDSYTGGELVIEGNDGESAVKLSAGSLILYPAATLHRVNPVTNGERLAVVGWIRSFIRADDRRELLFDLDNVVASLNESHAERAVCDRLHKVRANLLRMWADD
jgi:PKHD-type hydroxylase